MLLENGQKIWGSWKSLILLIGAPISTAFLVYYLISRKGDKFNGFVRSSFYQLELLIPADKVGAIIGREGTIIRQIERDYNVTLRVTNQKSNGSSTFDEDARTLMIRGRRDDVFVADLHVRKILADTPPTLSDEMTVPKSSLGSIIGKNGDNIREISRCTGAKVHIGTSGNEFETVTIKGKPESIERVKVLIEEKVKEDYEYRQKKQLAAGDFVKPEATWA